MTLEDRHDGQRERAQAGLSPDALGSPSHDRGRRAFLTATGALAVGAAALGKVSQADAQGEEESAFIENVAARRFEPLAPAQHRELRKHALRVRVQAAKAQFELPIALHPNNGDEQRYPNKIGSDTRGLPHDQRGEVDLSAWRLAERAHASGAYEDFENIPLGGSRKFVNPLGTLAVSLEGSNVTQLGIPPAPTLAGAERAAEAVEQYWQSVLRDVPFSQYADHADAQAAAAELDKLASYRGPRANGRVTPALLFRGSVLYRDPRDRSGRTGSSLIAPGVLEGPHLPQFLFREIPYGTQSIASTHRLPQGGQDFLLDYDEWLAIQDGEAPTRTIQFEATRRHLHNARDLAEHTHGGSPLFWGAVLLLAAGNSGDATNPGGIGAPLSPTNPYRSSKTQTGSNATFAVGHLQALLTVAVSRAVRAAYWQKFFVHRSLRPEAFAGLVYHHLENGVDAYPIHPDLLSSEGLARATRKFGTPLLAHAYPEGAPLHGSYPAGSAVTAGASATIVKAFFDESHVIANPVEPDPTDPTKLVPYTGAPLTVGGELNKLASISTFGRVLSGIHWRSDAAASLALGEQVAISVLQDERRTLREPFAGFSFTKFDGTTVVID